MEVTWPRNGTAGGVGMVDVIVQRTKRENGDGAVYPVQAGEGFIWRWRRALARALEAMEVACASAEIDHL